MLSQDEAWASSLASAIEELHRQVRSCSECGAITVSDVCEVCSDPSRDRKKICVIESQEDCAAIEQSGVYDGIYHVLNGRCSPLDGMEIPQESLLRLRERVQRHASQEVILALSPRVEGEMTAYAVQDSLSGIPVKITRLSYGLPVGGSIEYADRMTLHVALRSRREVDREADVSQ